MTISEHLPTAITDRRTELTMLAIDTLGFSKRLQAAGVDRQQAEAHAEALRDLVMVELATKDDLAAAVASISQSIDGLRLATKADPAVVVAGINQSIDNCTDSLKLHIEKLKRDLTISVGLMMASGVAFLAIMQQLL